MTTQVETAPTIPGAQMKKEIHEQPEAIARLLDNEMPRIWSMAERWRNRPPRWVIMVARGTSDHAALYGKYAFELHAGRFVGLGAPSVASIYQAKVDVRDALVIGISQSGEAADVIAVLDQARRDGADTLAITNVDGAPLTKAASETILLHANPELAVAATKTFTTTMAVMTLLAAAIGDDSALFNACKALPGLMADTLDASNDVPALAQRFRYMEECVSLGRGYNIALAYEFALKMRETSYVRVSPFASPDFVHGPIAILDEGYPVFAFANSGQTLPSLLQVVEKARSRGAETILIGNAANTWPQADVAIQVPWKPELPEALTPFPSAVVAQLLALSTACAKGYNPDQPRGLNKVTITK